MSASSMPYVHAIYAIQAAICQINLLATSSHLPSFLCRRHRFFLFQLMLLLFDNLLRFRRRVSRRLCAHSAPQKVISVIFLDFFSRKVPFGCMEPFYVRSISTVFSNFSISAHLVFV